MEILIYIIKSAALLSLFFLAYEILLKRDTHFSQNRVFLLLGLATSALLPALVFHKTVFVDPAPVSSVSVVHLSQMDDLEQNMAQNPSLWEQFTFWDGLLLLYLAGAFFFLVKFGRQLNILLTLLKTETCTYQENGINFSETDKRTGPFSFFNRVIYNPKLHSATELKLVLKHETAHVKNHHNLDIILANLFSICLWFNPLIFLYRKRICQNLEFLADREATQNTDSPKAYQRSLVNVCTEPPTQDLPITKFHNSFIKTRIRMLNKSKTPAKNSLKALLILPFLGFFLMGFQVKRVTKIGSANTIHTHKPTNIQSSKQIKTSFNDSTLSSFRVSIDKNTTQKTLDKFKKSLNDKFNLDFSYSQLKFNAKNEISRLKISVDCNDGFKGSVYDSDPKGIHTLYFKRDYTNAKKPFEIGKKPWLPKRPNSREIYNSIQRNGFFIFNGKKIYKKNAKGKAFKIDALRLKKQGKKTFVVIQGKRTKEDYRQSNEPVLHITKNGKPMQYGNFSGIPKTKKVRAKVIRQKKEVREKIKKERTKIARQRRKMKNKQDSIAKNRRAVLKKREEKRQTLQKRRMTIQKKRDSLSKIVKSTRQQMRKKRRELKRQRKGSAKMRQKTQRVLDSLKYHQPRPRFDPAYKTSWAYAFNINKTTPNSALDSYEKAFKKEGIIFSYSRLKRNAAGEIIAIKVKLDNQNGSKASAGYKNSQETIPTISLSVSDDGEVFIRTKKER